MLMPTMRTVMLHYMLASQHEIIMLKIMPAYCAKAYMKCLAILSRVGVAIHVMKFLNEASLVNRDCG